MNTFFRDYVDLTALCMICCITLFLAIRAKLKTGRHTRFIPVFALFFAPVALLVLMFFHLLENIYHAVINAMAGTFTYNFHFYAIVLLGLVLGSIAFFLLRACKKKANGTLLHNRSIFLYLGLIVLICLPLLPITPISMVPLVFCGISLAGLFFVTEKTA